MRLQEGVQPVRSEDFPRVVDVWEASVRATHHFITEADIQFFKPLVGEALHTVELACVRDTGGEITGFVAVAKGKIEMLFIHPDSRGMGIGKRLVEHVVAALGATAVDVNEQNEQALGFYLRVGFEVTGRSELDSLGKPFPLLHMRLKNTEGK